MFFYVHYVVNYSNSCPQCNLPLTACCSMLEFNFNNMNKKHKQQNKRSMYNELHLNILFQVTASLYSLKQYKCKKKTN